VRIFEIRANRNPGSNFFKVFWRQIEKRPLKRLIQQPAVEQDTTEMQSLPASLRVFADADAAPVWSARLNPKLYARLCTASDSCTPLVIRHLQHSILLNCLPDPRVCEAHVVVPTWLFASHASFSCNLDVSLLPLASWSPHSDSASQLFALAEKQIALPLSAITLQLMGTVVNGVLVSSSLINPFVSVSDAFCRQLIGQLVRNSI
jgi:hypothetical protein